MPKTADFIEAQSEAKGSAENTQSSKTKKKRGDSARIAAWQWKPGQSGNPGGRPKNDVARQIAQAAFENNPELVYSGLVKQMKRGNGFVFQVAADRAYGKLTDKMELNAGEELLLRLMAGRKRTAKPQPVEGK